MRVPKNEYVDSHAGVSTLKEQRCMPIAIWYGCGDTISLRVKVPLPNEFADGLLTEEAQASGVKQAV